MRLGCAILQNGRRWCSTRINPLTGIHVSGQGQWGYCNSNCPNYENGMFPSHILYPIFLWKSYFHKTLYLFQILQVHQPQQDHQRQQVHQCQQLHLHAKLLLIVENQINHVYFHSSFKVWHTQVGVWIFWNEIMFARTIKID